MQFLTQVLGRTVFDSVGEPIGKVHDVIATPAEPLPVVSAIVVKNGREKIIPWRLVREEVDRITLVVRKDRISEYTPTENDIWLRREVLDRQIVDVHDYKVVRVNDVRFVETPGQVRLLGVDASTRGLLRELGIEWLANLFHALFKRPVPEKIISWDDVETFERATGPIKLKIPLEKLSKLHPSDIADIIEQMNPAQRADIIENLDVETAADVLPEASPEIQAEIIEDIDPERASDILEEMDPDEAADILGDLPEERTEELLREMEPSEAKDVRELLSYEDETAGGLMTTDYVAIPSSMTAQQAIDYLRELKPDAETIYYLYVVNEDKKLVGVISLRDLIVAEPDKPVSAFMITRVI
ncbi:MAG: CBS domain-containing protein, partial [Armatimonadota bacterium]|nr:CBS domain-containing protein [Armatimonadota bacterium]